MQNPKSCVNMQLCPLSNGMTVTTRQITFQNRKMASYRIPLGNLILLFFLSSVTFVTNSQRAGIYSPELYAGLTLIILWTKCHVHLWCDWTLTEGPRWMLIIMGANWLSSSEVQLRKSKLILQKYKLPAHGSWHLPRAEMENLDHCQNWTTFLTPSAILCV